MNPNDITYPLFGIVRNDEGLREFNYLYTRDELKSFDKHLYEDVVSSPDNFAEGAFFACDTYNCRMLNNAAEVTNFLTGAYNGLPVSEESEDYEELKQDWYWESVINNDMYCEISHTLRIMVKKLGLTANQLIGCAD